MQDLNNIGFNQATVSTLGCFVCTLLGAWGQKKQIEKIWRNKSAEKVSHLMSIIMFTLFASYLVRGIAEHRMMYLTQGVIRAGLFVPVILGIIRFDVLTKNNWIQLSLGILLLGLMFAFESFRITGFTIVMYLGLIGACHQVWSVRKMNGQVSFIFYLTMLASVSFQSWYGWYYKDIALLIPCLGFVTLYTITLLMMVRNLKTKNTVASK